MIENADVHETVAEERKAMTVTEFVSKIKELGERYSHDLENAQFTLFGVNELEISHVDLHSSYDYKCPHPKCDHRHEHRVLGIYFREKTKQKKEKK